MRTSQLIHSNFLIFSNIAIANIKNKIIVKGPWIFALKVYHKDMIYLLLKL